MDSETNLDFKRLYQVSEVDIAQEILMNGKFYLVIGNMDHGLTVTTMKGQKQPYINVEVIDHSEDSAGESRKLYIPSQIENMETGKDNVATCYWKILIVRANLMTPMTSYCGIW